MWKKAQFQTRANCIRNIDSSKNYGKARFEFVIIKAIQNGMRKKKNMIKSTDQSQNLPGRKKMQLDFKEKGRQDSIMLSNIFKMQVRNKSEERKKLNKFCRLMTGNNGSLQDGKKKC